MRAGWEDWGGTGTVWGKKWWMRAQGNGVSLFKSSSGRVIERRVGHRAWTTRALSLGGGGTSEMRVPKKEISMMGMVATVTCRLRAGLG